MNARIVIAAAAWAALLASPARAQDSTAADTLDRVVPLPEVVVSTTRPGDRAPFARAVLSRKEIVERNWGQDTPMALASLPGAYAYSDAGNGVGYSYLSIRGFPQRRISVLVNGVPLNDPESHEVYWIDHPDLLASTTEAQVQRGVGSALYGAASLGGSVNLETSPFTESPAVAVAVGYGSWETKRLMVEGNSGRLRGGWSLYGRYSRVESFGYREQSWSKLWSYALSARRQAGRHALRLNLYGGPEETHLAYLGVPRAYLDGAVTGDRERDRRFNPILYPNERDHFFEPHYELMHSWSPRAGLALSQTLFYFDGKGFYDEQRFGRSLADYRLPAWYTADEERYPAEYFARDPGGNVIRDSQGRALLERFDLVRRRTVENRHYGWIPRMRIEHAAGELTVGGEIRAHDGRHFGEVISGSGLPPGTQPDHVYYDYHPRTLSGGLFLREEYRPLERLALTADLAWRHQRYAMRGDRTDPVFHPYAIRFDQRYDFGLPRLGLTWTPRSDVSVFASWAHAAREPAFRDLYDAEGVGSVPLYAVRDAAAGVYRDPLITPERVHDWGLGGEWRSERARASAHLFRMDFQDELVYAGQFNTDLGYPILGNAARSVHQGIELAGRLELPLPRAWGLRLDANATLSDNHFVRYRETYGTTPADVVVYDGNAIGFFPGAMAHLEGRVSAGGVSLGAAGRYIGRIHLDHAESEVASIAPHAILDLVGTWRARASPGVQLGLRVLNALDREYESGGYMDYDAVGNLVPHYVPAATRTVLGEVRVEF